MDPPLSATPGVGRARFIITLTFDGTDAAFPFKGVVVAKDGIHPVVSRELFEAASKQLPEALGHAHAMILNDLTRMRGPTSLEPR